jgi:hypothetical protein
MSSEKIVLPPPSVGKHEVEMPAAVKASVPMALQAGGDAVEASAADAAAVHPREVIDLDGPDIPGNDTTIFEAALERLLLEPEESGAEASMSVAPEAATTTGAVEAVKEEPALDVAAIVQPELNLVEAVWALEAPAKLETTEGVLGILRQAQSLLVPRLRPPSWLRDRLQ